MLVFDTITPFKTTYGLGYVTCFFKMILFLNARQETKQNLTKLIQLSFNLLIISFCIIQKFIINK